MKLRAKSAILRTAIRSTEDQDTWILKGRLAGQVVDELTASWKRAVSEEPRRKRVVDLAGVTVVDENGEQTLLEMLIDNAQLVVRGVYMWSLLDSRTNTVRGRSEPCGLSRSP
jgi:ABC-type transporter Mla MlaB component